MATAANSGSNGKSESRNRSEIHPNPQFQREHWQSLNGEWQFLYDDGLAFHYPADIKEWTHKIQVPFAPECALSGIGDQGFHRRCWYQKTISLKANPSGRTLLHFGAVDYHCRVWINGRFAGGHEGGHTPFTLDITDASAEGAQQVITVCADDNPLDLAKPRGKQDWQLKPHSIWYPRTTGIWQTVWVEQVPRTYLKSIRWTPHLERWEIACEARVEGENISKMYLRIKLMQDQNVLANDYYQVILGEVCRGIALSDPGIDDFRNELLWSPERPTLIQAVVQLCGEDGHVVDEVRSYTALRSVGTSRDRFMLNGRPYYLRLVLDQGYWPESLMTAPSAEAFRKDIELTKKMGFNGVRKHQKIEDPLYLYYADVMGLLVWEEMPSAYRFTQNSIQRITREWIEVIERDYNHPCIVTWVPFNESWGVPDLAEKVEHQNYVQALYYLTRTLDPTRPVIGNDGWESSATDIIGIHDYDADPAKLSRRYGAEMTTADILGRRRPAGRLLTLDGHPHQGQPILLTEFGGIALVRKDGEGADPTSWGYSVSQTTAELESRYQRLLMAVNQIELFSGFCYTQLTDTFQEANGLLYDDRTPKFSLPAVSAATLGTGFEREERVASSESVGNSSAFLGNA